MAQTTKLTATDGTPVEFVDEVIGSGSMKDVYFSPDKSYVVGFFSAPQDADAKDRLQNIVETHWFVFDNSTKPRCPFCGTEYHGQLPVLNLYYSPAKGKFPPEKYHLMVYDRQSLYM